MVNFDFCDVGSKENWDILFSLNAAFILLGMIALSVCPESPVYLFVLKGKEEKAITGIILSYFQTLQAFHLYPATCI